MRGRRRGRASRQKGRSGAARRRRRRLRLGQGEGRCPEVPPFLPVDYASRASRSSCGRLRDGAKVGCLDWLLARRQLLIGQNVGASIGFRPASPTVGDQGMHRVLEAKASVKKWKIYSRILPYLLASGSKRGEMLLENPLSVQYGKKFAQFLPTWLSRRRQNEVTVIYVGKIPKSLPRCRAVQGYAKWRRAMQGYAKRRHAMR